MVNQNTKMASKRPTDKFALVTNEIISTAQTNLVEHTAEVAETYNGGVINYSFASLVDGMSMVVFMIVPEGITTPTINLNTGNNLMIPETFILWSKVFISEGIENSLSGTDRIKTKRKMQKGDRLILGLHSDATNHCRFAAINTGFMKQ